MSVTGGSSRSCFQSTTGNALVSVVETKVGGVGGSGSWTTTPDSSCDLPYWCTTKLESWGCFCPTTHIYSYFK